MDKILEMIEKGESFIIVPMKKGSKKPHRNPEGNVITHGIVKKQDQNILYTHFPALCGSIPKESSVGWINSNKGISCDICRRKTTTIYWKLRDRKMEV